VQSVAQARSLDSVLTQAVPAALANTVHIVDTVWVAVPSSRSFAEDATGWGTLLLALFALVGLVLGLVIPSWDRRRHRTVTDHRLGVAAYGLSRTIDDLIIEAEHARAECGVNIDLVERFIPELATHRDRITELAIQAKDASPQTAARFTSAFVQVTAAASICDRVVRLKRMKELKHAQELLADRFDAFVDHLKSYDEQLQLALDEQTRNALSAL
jgi:hypothetical protein